MNADRQALLNLVDALSDRTAHTPEEELLREVSEDHGHAQALADDFDRILKPLLAPNQRTARPQGWYHALLQGLERAAECQRHGRFYRAQVGPFMNSEDAKAFCGDLKATGGDCLVITDSINP